MAVKVGEGPAAKRYKAMLAAEKAEKDKKPAPKPTPKKAPAKPKSLIEKLKERKRQLDNI